MIEKFAGANPEVPMGVIIGIILGIVQGLCEFLPVSSSGHLVLLQNVFGIEENALFFTIMLHIGTLVAVFVVYRKVIGEMLLSVIKFLGLLFTGKWQALREHVKTPVQLKLFYLIIATLVTVVMALVFNDLIDESYEGKYLGFGFIITSLVLFSLNFVKRKGRTMKWWNACGIGFMQGIAILPGISRSGSTIAGATWFGLRKEDAAEFSFMLSIPAILGSLVLEVPDVIREGFGSVNWLQIGVGVVFAAVSGYFAIKWMIKLIVNKSLNIFAVYTAILGVLVLLDQFVFNIFMENPFM